MRLSAELLGSSEQRTNPLGEREIVLRGLAIPAIEHLGVTRDAFDVIDFSDNRLSSLENFPRLLRLNGLNLAGNVIDSVDATNIAKNIPNLTNIDLSHNQIGSLLQVANLGKSCSKLQFLSLHGNPVTRRQHYRLYTIKHIPSLKVLDFTKITRTERERADRLANSAAGAALEADVQGEASGVSSGAKTFVPGEGESAEDAFKTNFSPEEKEMIRQMVANAKSPAEIEEIERSVKRGILPKMATTEAADDGASSGKKRPATENGDDGDAKKSRVESGSGES